MSAILVFICASILSSKTPGLLLAAWCNLSDQGFRLSLNALVLTDMLNSSLIIVAYASNLTISSNSHRVIPALLIWSISDAGFVFLESNCSYAAIPLSSISSTASVETARLLYKRIWKSILVAEFTLSIRNVLLTILDITSGAIDLHIASI